MTAFSVIEGFYQGKILRPAEARSAFALIRLRYPEATLGGWRDCIRQASRCSSRQGGIVAVFDRRRCIHALYVYRLREAARPGAAPFGYSMAELAAVGLPGAAPAAAVRACAAACLARELGLRWGAVAVEPQAVPARLARTLSRLSQAG